MDFNDKKFTIPRSSSRKKFIKSLDESIDLFDNMANALENEKMLINIESIPNDALDLSSISTTYNIYVKQLIKIFNNNENVNLIIDYTNLLEKNSISKLKIKDTSKIIQKYSQEMNTLQKNNKNLKNIEIELNKQKQKKSLSQIKKTHIILKQICKKYKKYLAKNNCITPMTFNCILSTKNAKGLLHKLKNIKFKVEELINIYRTNKHIQSQKQGFFSKIISSLKSLGNYFARKYRIRKIFNYIQRDEKGISKCIEKIKMFFKIIKENIKSLKAKVVGNFDKNFTYSNLKEILKNIKYKTYDIYYNSKTSKTKDIKNMISDALKSNSMPESKNEKNLFSCIIYIKMINCLFIIMNGEDDLTNIYNLSRIKLKQILSLKNTFEMFKIILTILSIVVTIASFILPLVGIIGAPLWGSLISIKL